MAGTGETPETGAPGPKGWIGTSRTYNEEGTEIETEMIAIFLSLDQAKQWARKMADIARDDNIEEKLPGLSRKPWPLDITIGADPQRRSLKSVRESRFWGSCRRAGVASGKRYAVGASPEPTMRLTGMSAETT
jgi:hypothetical protein